MSSSRLTLTFRERKRRQGPVLCMRCRRIFSLCGYYPPHGEVGPPTPHKGDAELLDAPRPTASCLSRSRSLLRPRRVAPLSALSSVFLHPLNVPAVRRNNSLLAYRMRSYHDDDATDCHRAPAFSRTPARRFPPGLTFPPLSARRLPRPFRRPRRKVLKGREI